MTTLIARYARSLVWLSSAVGLMWLAGCRSSYRYEKVVAVPFPSLPDTVHSHAGPIPVRVVDTIPTPVDRPNALVVGRYDVLNRVIYIKKGQAPLQARKVLEHERCHAILLDTGLHNHFGEVPWLVELLCDNVAAVRVAELSRGRP